MADLLISGLISAKPLAAPVAELRRYACIDHRVIYFARLEIPTRYVQMKFDLIENRTHV